MYFFFPETNGRHLEEVDQIFRDSKNIFDPVKVAHNMPSHVWAEDEIRQEKATADSTEYVRAND